MGSLQEYRKLACVTGASSGVGYELARQFALHDHDLIVVAEDGGIERLPGDFAELGCQVQALQLDLATLEGVRALQRAIQTEFRPLDALAINAGVGVCGDFARETAWAEELNLIQLNVLATVQLTKLVLPEMTQRRFGRVLITSSIAALTPTPYEAVYGASKAFLLSFACSLHAELKGSGVNVTALIPGPSPAEFFHREPNADWAWLDEASYASDAAEVARLGYQALMAGEERVVASSMRAKLRAAVA